MFDYEFRLEQASREVEIFMAESELQMFLVAATSIFTIMLAAMI